MNNKIENILELKRSLLVGEAKKMLHLDTIMGDSNEYLVRSIASDVKSVKGNWGISFVRYCVEGTDDICHRIFGKEYNHSNLKWNDNIMEFWQGIDKRNKKNRPTVGDIVIMHHVKNGQLATSGQLGIITNVNRDLTFNTIEGGIVSGFETEPISQQKMGVKERLRVSKGTAKMRVLGFISPWMDR